MASTCKISISDSIILIAAIAAGFGLTRFLWQNGSFEWSFEIDGIITYAQIFRRSIIIFTPFAFFLCVALGIIGFRKKQNACPPGTLACIAVPLAAAFRAVLDWNLYIYASVDKVDNVVDFIEDLIADPTLMAFGIMLAWSTLFLVRAWGPESSWTDRMGFVMAAYWISSGILMPFIMRFYYVL